MDAFDDTSQAPLEWRLRTYAAALAADVAGARYDWGHASRTFSNAPLRKGMDPQRVSEMFSEAWDWGKQHPSRWMDLPRSWIWNQVDDTFLNVGSGDCIDRDEFGQLNDYLCPLAGWSTAQFLIAEDLIYRVEAVEQDRALAKQFYIGDGLLVFNYA